MSDISISDSSIQAVIFDMDGVIVDSEPVYNDLLRQWMRDHLGEIDDTVYAEVLGKTWLKVFEYVKERKNVAIDPEAESDALRDRIVEYIAHTGIPMRDGARAAIEKLSEQYTLAVVSSSPRLVVERMLAHHRLMDKFAHVTAVEDVQYPKPHPQPYAMTMLALGVAPEASVVVEDSIPGIQSGLAAQAFVYALPDPRLSAEPFMNLGAKVIWDFNELLEDLL